MTKVLIIDDDQSFLKILTISLHDKGFEVYTALTGGAGIKLTGTEHPDIILLDLILTDIPGLEVVKAIKQNEELAAIPIVMLTSYGNDSVEIEADKLGIAGYLQKYKIQMNDIGEYLNNLIAQHTIPPVEPQK